MSLSKAKSNRSQDSRHQKQWQGCLIREAKKLHNLNELGRFVGMRSELLLPNYSPVSRELDTCQMQKIKSDPAGRPSENVLMPSPKSDN